MSFKDTVYFINTSKTKVLQKDFTKKSKRDGFIKHLADRYVPTEKVDDVRASLADSAAKDTEAPQRTVSSSLRDLPGGDSSGSSNSDDEDGGTVIECDEDVLDGADQRSEDDADLTDVDEESDSEAAEAEHQAPRQRKPTRRAKKTKRPPAQQVIPKRLPAAQVIDIDSDVSSDDSDNDSSTASVNDNDYQAKSVPWVQQYRAASSTASSATSAAQVPDIFKARCVAERAPTAVEVDKYDLTKPIFSVVYTDLFNLHEGSAVKLVNHRIHWGNRSYRKHALSYATIFDQATCEAAFVKTQVDLRDLKFLELLVRRVLGFYFADVHEDASYLDILALNPTEDVPLSAGFNQIVQRGAKNYNSSRLKAHKVRESAKKRKRGPRKAQEKRTKKAAKSQTKSD